MYLKEKTGSGPNTPKHDRHPLGPVATRAQEKDMPGQGVCGWGETQMARTRGAQKAEGKRSLSGVPVKAFHLGG